MRIVSDLNVWSWSCEIFLQSTYKKCLPMKLSLGILDFLAFYRPGVKLRTNNGFYRSRIAGISSFTRSTTLKFTFKFFLQPQLITKAGYPSERHRANTSDGYILQLHRIPAGRRAARRSGATAKGKKAVLIVHGLLGSSSDFIIMGPDRSLGEWRYIFFLHYVLK